MLESGGGVMGLIASFFATGIVTIAGHSLPFGPTIAGFARFALDGERNVVIPTGGQMKDGPIVDELHGERFEEKDRTSMLIPVDDVVIGMVAHLSDGGALAGDQPFRAIHPSYNDELFNNRLGLQVGAKRTAVNNAHTDLVKSPAGESVFWMGSIPQKDPEFATYRERQIGPNLKPEGDQIIVVVRVAVNIDATDDDRLFRFGLGTVRLVANAKNHFPEGTMEAGTLMNGKPDDYLFLNFGGTGTADELVDFVFLVDRTDITDETPGPKQSAKIKSGTFIEVKKLARVDLSGKDISPVFNPIEKSALLRHPDKLIAQAYAHMHRGAVAPTPVAAPAPGNKGPETPAIIVKENDHVEYLSAAVSPKIFSTISLTIPDENANGIEFAGVKGNIRARKWESLEVDPKENLAKLADADYPIEELSVPDGKKIVQVKMSPSSKANDPWSWAAKVADFEVVDEGGVNYKPNGAMAKVKVGGQDTMAAKFSIDTKLKELKRSEGRPTEIYLIFIVPQGVNLRSLNFEGKSFVPINVK